MPRHSDDPVAHVISFRVNNEEKRMLRELAKRSRCSISDFLRKNLQMLSDADENFSRV